MYLDIALKNANVHTLNPTKPTAEAVGVREGKIELVGKEEKIERQSGEETKRIDCKGYPLLPAFIDAHTHFSSMGVRMENHLDLAEVDCKRELLEKVEAEAPNCAVGREEWFVGYNWDESGWKEGKSFPRKEELDDVLPHRPVALIRVDGHLACVNGKALDLLDLDPELQGFEREKGEPTGRLAENAADAVREAIQPNVEEIAEGVRAATKRAHQLGVSGVQDASAGKGQLRAYQTLAKEGELGVRVSAFPRLGLLDQLIQLGLRPGFGDSWFELGPVKLFVDGSVGAKTAWVGEGYRENPANCGTAIWESEELKGFLEEAQAEGIKVAIHAIGDKAILETLAAVEGARKKYGEVKHRLEHGEMLGEEELIKMKELGMTYSAQPNFVGNWGQPGGMYEERLGRERLEGMNPFKPALEKGIPLAFGSDCMPFDPFYGIHSAVHAPFEGQRLTPEEAIRAYTLGSARAAGWEERLGSIEKGKRADLLLLNDDPFQRPGEIKEMGPQLLLVEGKIVNSNI